MSKTGIVDWPNIKKSCSFSHKSGFRERGRQNSVASVFFPFLPFFLSVFLLFFSLISPFFFCFFFAVSDFSVSSLSFRFLLFLSVCFFLLLSVSFQFFPFFPFLPFLSVFSFIFLLFCFGLFYFSFHFQEKTGRHRL